MTFYCFGATIVSREIPWHLSPLFSPEPWLDGQGSALVLWWAKQGRVDTTSRVLGVSENCDDPTGKQAKAFLKISQSNHQSPNPKFHFSLLIFTGHIIVPKLKSQFNGSKTYICKVLKACTSDILQCIHILHAHAIPQMLGYFEGFLGIWDAQLFPSYLVAWKSDLPNLSLSMCNWSLYMKSIQVAFPARVFRSSVRKTLRRSMQHCMAVVLRRLKNIQKGMLGWWHRFFEVRDLIGYLCPTR